MIKKTDTQIGNLDTDRSVAHIDSRDPQHGEDQKKARKDREEALNWMESNSDAFLEGRAFPSLGLGTVLDIDGKELSRKELKKLVQKVKKERNFYWQDATKKGKPYRRKWYLKYNKKGARSPIKQCSVSYKPDFSFALSDCDNSDLPISDLVKGQSLKVAKEFQKETGYDPIAVCLHPKEGNLHFHIIFSHIDTENNKLHRSRGKGNPRLRRASSSIVGMSRMVDEGIPINSGQKTKYEAIRADRVREGREPYDLVLSQYLDGLVNLWVMDQPIETRRRFNRAAKIWYKHHQGKFDADKKIQNLELDLNALAEKGTQDRKGFESRIAGLEDEKKELKEELSKVSKKHDSLKKSIEFNIETWEQDFEALGKKREALEKLVKAQRESLDFVMKSVNLEQLKDILEQEELNSETSDYLNSEFGFDLRPKSKGYSKTPPPPPSQAESPPPPDQRR